MTSNQNNQAVVVVGAGHAAGEFATSLRNEGWVGKIVLVGEESCLPYQRPPLSKAFLAGELATEQLLLKPQATYDKAGIEVIRNTRVEAVERSSKTVRLSDGKILPYEKLVFATGGRPRKLSLPGSEAAQDQANFHYLRTVDDVSRMHLQFQPGVRLVIIGGGYIGLEVAAVAIKRGLKVTVLEALPRVLARVTAPEISAFYERIHREQGVDLRTGVQLAGFELDPSGDAVSAVLLADGTRVPADMVIVGIGLIANTELAEAAGLAVDNGIVVDDQTRTGDPDIFAIGDCTNHPNGVYGRRIRLESVPNALEQARTAAGVICGKDKHYNAVPWFWSDQYDLKLKMVGLSQGYEQLVVRGTSIAGTTPPSFSAFYLKEGYMLAADTINRPQEFMLTKRFVAERIAVDPAALADDAIPLKSLLPQI